MTLVIDMTYYKFGAFEVVNALIKYIQVASSLNHCQT